jgi:hypothetical protein
MRISILVEKLLNERPALRSNDKLLILEVWAYYGLNLTPDQEYRFLDMPSPETIRRIRQKLQEKGRYPPDPQIAKNRRWRQMQMQQRTPKASPKYIEQTLL